MAGPKPIPTYKELCKLARKQLDADHKHWREMYRKMKGEKEINGDVTFPEFLSRISEAVALRDHKRLVRKENERTGK